MKKQIKQKAGFTLIEMLVSTALFTVVMVISMGAILTVMDSNKKAQTLTSVMNNLSFALETMTRSIKTGVDPKLETNGIVVDGIDLTALDFSRKKIHFKFLETEGGTDPQGYIGKCVGTCGNDTLYIPITAPEVDIDEFAIISHGYTDAGDQPRTFIFMEGKVVFSNRIKSTFKVQTTISQRRLDVVGSESSI